MCVVYLYKYIWYVCERSVLFICVCVFACWVLFICVNIYLPLCVCESLIGGGCAPGGAGASGES